jgi:peroxiredoxin
LSFGSGSSRINVILWCLAASLVLCSCGSQENSNPQEIASDKSSTQLKECPQEECLAPGFTLSDLTGKPVSLSDYKGKVVLLNIWATWCGPCKREIPSLDKLYQLKKNKGFEILAVSVDRTSTSSVASFVSNYQMSFPVLHDTRGEVARKYRANAIPKSFLLDREGVIRWLVAGSIDWNDPSVSSRIDRLLSQ